MGPRSEEGIRFLDRGVTTVTVGEDTPGYVRMDVDVDCAGAGP